MNRDRMILALDDLADRLDFIESINLDGDNELTDIAERLRDLAYELEKMEREDNAQV